MSIFKFNEIDYESEVKSLRELIQMYENGILVDDGGDREIIEDKLMFMERGLLESNERKISLQNKPLMMALIKFILWVRRVLGINKLEK